MSRLLYAYLAGTIDADGFITIARSRKTGAQYHRNPIYYNAKIGLQEISPIVPDLLHATFGGSRYEHQPANPRHHKWYSWVIQDRSAAIAIRRLLPFLRLKQQQASLTLQLIDLQAAQRKIIQKTQKPPYRVTPDMVAARHDLWAAVTVLNAPRNRRVHFLDPAPDQSPD